MFSRKYADRACSDQSTLFTVYTEHSQYLKLHGTPPVFSKIDTFCDFRFPSQALRLIKDNPNGSTVKEKNFLQEEKNISFKR